MCPRISQKEKRAISSGGVSGKQKRRIRIPVPALYILWF